MKLEDAKRLANKVTAAAKELNTAIAEAAALGLTVDVDVFHLDAAGLARAAGVHRIPKIDVETKVRPGDLQG